MSQAISPRILLMLTLPPLLWAGNAIVGRLLVDSAPPVALNALRWSLALLLLLPLGWRTLTRPRDLAGRWPHLMLLGLLGVGCYNMLQYLALQTSSPINVTLIGASMPLWMLAVGWLLYREQPSAWQFLGALFSLAGVALVISRGRPAALLGLELVAGDLLMLLATALWAIYSWMLARPPAPMRAPLRPAWNWAEFLFLQVAFGTFWAGLAAGVEAAIDPGGIRWSAGVLLGIAYVAIGPSILAFWCWGAGVAAVGPSLAAFFNNLTPVFTALMSAALLREPPRWYHVAAFMLIAAGIVATARRRPSS